MEKIKLKDIQNTTCSVWFGNNEELKEFVEKNNITLGVEMYDTDVAICFFEQSLPLTINFNSYIYYDVVKYHYFELEKEKEKDLPLLEKPVDVVTKDSNFLILFCNLLAIFCVYLSKLIIVNVDTVSEQEKSMVGIATALVVFNVIFIDIDHFDIFKKFRIKTIIHSY
jgi:hypothetical protein